MRPYTTPPKLAERLGVSPEKVLTWIKNGELRAVDVSESRGGRPRWRIAESDIELFLTRRSVSPATPIKRTRRAAAASDVIRFF